MSEPSPDFLDTRPGRSAGVRRLNRVPLAIAGVLVLLILAAISYTYSQRLAGLRGRAGQQDNQPAAATPGEVFRDAPDGGLIPANKRDEPSPQPVEKTPPVELDLDAERRRQEWARLREARLAALQQAIRAPSGILHNTPAQTAPAKTEEAPTSGTNPLAEAVKRRLAFGDNNEEKDINRAAEKAAWLKDRAPESVAAHYLPGGREAPLSRYELKAGTVIPAVMISGINSDLPGQIIGQVAENVYDTASGRHILIPQGAKLVGTYDNAITTGQERVLVAWTRIIYPDASSIDLGKMPGTDSAGFAGLHDEVDNHTWKIFGNALLMSVFSAGIQLSQGTSSSSSGQTAQETITASLGQQLGQLGQEMARRNVQIQPTLIIRPGMKFTVAVTKDIVIRPWRANKATAAQ